VPVPCPTPAARHRRTALTSRACRSGKRASYLPDLPRRADDEEHEADPERSDAARAYTGNVRRALALLDDAVNLAGTREGLPEKRSS
jgi:hypothetical protein